MSTLALSCSLNPFPGCAQWFCLLQCHDVIAYDNDVLLYLGAQAMNQRDHILYVLQHIHPNLQVCLFIWRNHTVCRNMRLESAAAAALKKWRLS